MSKRPNDKTNNFFFFGFFFLSFFFYFCFKFTSSFLPICIDWHPLQNQTVKVLAVISEAKRTQVNKKKKKKKKQNNQKKKSSTTNKNTISFLVGLTEESLN
jgi:hypothetical protein